MRKYSVLLGVFIGFALGYLASTGLKTDSPQINDKTTNLEKRIDTLERMIKELKKETNYYKLLNK